MPSLIFSDHTSLSPIKERVFAIFLGIAGALGYVVCANLYPEFPLSLVLRDVPLFFAALTLSPLSLGLAIFICYLPLCTLLPFPLLLILPNILAIISVALVSTYYKKIPIHLLPCLTLLIFTPFTESHLTFNQPISASVCFLAILIACLTAILLRYVTFTQEFLGIIEPKGWFAYLVPFYSALLILPFSFSLLPDDQFLTYAAVILLSLTSVGLLPKETENIEESMPTIGFKPKGFSGINKEYFQRKNSEFETAIGLTTKLSSVSDTQSGKNLTATRKDGIMVIHQNGEVTFLNRKLREFFSLTSPHVIGQNFQELPLPEEAKERIKLLIPSTLQHGSRITELRLFSGSGQTFLEIRADKADSIEDSSLGGDPNLVIFRIKDITDKRNLEQHLARTHLIETLGILVKKSLPPLQQLLEHSLKESKEPYLIEIAHAIKKISDFAEEHGSAAIINVSDCIKENKDELQRASAAEIEIEDTEEQLYVRISPYAFLHILTSILSNAAESYPESEKKSVRVQLASEELDNEVIGLNPSAHPGKFIRIKVIDTGEGMSPDVLSKAFEPLFTSKKAAGHHGLGLSVSFSLLRAVDGFLTLESSPGKGTTVTIYLPLVNP